MSGESVKTVESTVNPPVNRQQAVGLMSMVLIIIHCVMRKP